MNSLCAYDPLQRRFKAMLTWALVVLATITGRQWETAVPYFVAMGCDVAIFYWIAQVFIHH
jgi:hypothetical protein